MNNPIPPQSAFQNDPQELGRILEAADLARPIVAEGISSGEMDGALRKLFILLFDQGIQHVLVGGLALIQYVPVRNTEDVDIIVALEDVPKISGLSILERNEWFAAAQFGPLSVDLLFTANPFFKEIAVKFSESKYLIGNNIPCATPTGLLLLKLFALPSLYRQGNITRADLYETDITMLLRRYPHPPELLLNFLSEYMISTDINALNKVLLEITERMNRPNSF